MAVLMAAGCTTTTYTSQKPAGAVSECIADGWRSVPDSKAKLPVTLTKTSDYYFIDVVLVRDFPTGLPIHSTWAKVRPSPLGDTDGSVTEYRRNFQIMHKKIDRVVQECQ